MKQFPPGTLRRDDALAGKFEAVFPDGRGAADFVKRMSGGGFWVKDVKLNRVGGRVVTFTSTERGLEDPRQHWLDMAETVGYYGSSFGEPPFGSGRKTAYLNGLPCSASM